MNGHTCICHQSNWLLRPAHLLDTAARLVYKLRKYDHISPALIPLHWLTVKYQMQFKTLLPVRDCMARHRPTSQACSREALAPGIPWDKTVHVSWWFQSSTVTHSVNEPLLLSVPCYGIRYHMPPDWVRMSMHSSGSWKPICSLNSWTNVTDGYLGMCW